jgi:hypothetical protein
MLSVFVNCSKEIIKTIINLYNRRSCDDKYYSLALLYFKENEIVVTISKGQMDNQLSNFHNNLPKKEND